MRNTAKKPWLWLRSIASSVVIVCTLSPGLYCGTGVPPVFPARQHRGHACATDLFSGAPGKGLATAESPATAPASQPGHTRERSIFGIFHIGHNLVRLSPTAQVLTIVGCTLISEDVTCITTGTLIQHHEVPWLRGGAACFLGIYIGDLFFFFLGRFAGSRLLKLHFFSRSLGEQRLKGFGEWFDKKPWAAIMACRFLPGLRVPLYLSVGALSHRTKAFFGWTCFFAFVWTPALIGVVVLLGDAIAGPLEFVFGKGWWTIPVTILLILGIVKLVILLSTSEGRSKLKGWVIRRSTAGA
jgi:membrane protein DedA with SNARE-associated domain